MVRPYKTPDGNWRVCIRKKGFKNIDKRFNSEVEAQHFIAVQESYIADAKKSEHYTVPRLPLSIWIDRWKEEIGPTRNFMKKEMYLFNFWDEQLGNEIAVDLSGPQIDRVADLILERDGKNGEKATRETRRKYLMMLSSLYTTAMRSWKWAAFNPLTCVDLHRKIEEKKNLTKEIIPEFEEFRQEFVSIIKDKMLKENITKQMAARICGISLHGFQHSIDPKNNITLRNLIKILNDFGYTITIDEYDENY